VKGGAGVAGVLHICTGNLCRSPIAERLMVDGLHRHYGAIADTVVVQSRGLGAVVGARMHPLSVAELERRGIDASGFVARQLDLRELDRADLVLTATRRQRDEVIASRPAKLGRVFTWRELAWLLDDLGNTIVRGDTLIDRVRILPKAAGLRRGHLRPPSPEEFDVADPIGGTELDFKQAAAEIDDAIETIISVL
jgi:protein-tyrosine phosphatase